MELIYTSPNNASNIYITFPITFILSLWIIFKLRNMEVKAKLSGGLFILMMMGSQLDAKYKIDSIQKAIKSGCSITNCEIVTGEVIKYRSYKDSSKKGYQENEFFIDGYKFSFDEKGETFAYGIISENGGVLIPNSGKYKIYLYNEKIIKLWRLNEQI